MIDTSDLFSTPKFIVVIVDAEKTHELINSFNDEHPPVLFQFHAYGTATSEMMDILGLGGVDKTVIISVAPGHYAKWLIPEIIKELKQHHHEEGIVFSIPISGIALRAMALLTNDAEPTTDNSTGSEENNMKNEIEHDLLIVAANRGYSEAIVEVAKQAGATGGTVWVAGKISPEDPIKVLGVTLQSEQDMIAMLVKRENKHDIMLAVNNKFGIESEAQGLIMSLPVDSVHGLKNNI